MNSLYDSLSKRKVKALEAGEFNAGKGWLGNFRKMFDFNKCWDNRTRGSEEFPDAIKKTVCPNGFLMQTKVPYSGKECHKTLVSKEAKLAPGIKARRNRPSLLFCVNVVGFKIKTVLIYKAANTWALEGEDKNQLPVFWLYGKKSRTTRTFFWIVSSDALFRKSRSQKVLCQ